MRRKWLTAISAVVIFIFLSFSIQALAADKTFKWIFPTSVPDSHPYGQIFEKHFKIIAEKSNGRLIIDHVSWGETPYKGFEALRLLRDGLIPSCQILFGYVSGDAPLLGGPELHFMLPKLTLDLNEYYAAYTKCWNDPKVRVVTDSILKKFNAVSLGVHYWGPQNWYTRPPLTKPSEFAGMKIREYSAEGSDMLKALGASAMVITAPEVYTGLQRGVVDGVVTAVQSMLSLKWGEVLKYEYVANPKPAGNFFGVSRKAFESLPADLQQLLTEEALAACEEINEWVIKDTPATIEILKKDYDWTITEATQEDYQKLRELAKKHVWSAWLDRVGPEGKEMLNACFKAMSAPDRY